MGVLELLQTLKKHSGRVWCVAWHPKGDCLATCGEDKTIRLWSKDIFNNWTNKVILDDGHKRTIREVAWSPCGNYIASASFDATTSIWDKKTGQFECNTTLEGHESEVKSVAWSKSGAYLATASRDKTVWVWEAADDDDFDCSDVLSAHVQDVKKVIFHPEKDILVTASYDTFIIIYKLDPTDNHWGVIFALNTHTSTVWSLSFNSTGTMFASCSDDKTVRIWKEYAPGNTHIPLPDNESVWKNVCTLSGYHTRPIYDIDWCKKTGLIATACGDNIIRVFKMDDGCDEHAPTFSLVSSCEQAHTQDVNSVAWQPHGDLLASCSDDAEVKLWKFVE